MHTTDQSGSAAFEGQSDRLVAIAYGMLGVTAEAEDVVQEAFARWHEAERSGVRSPAAFLTTVVTRLAIDRLRSAERRRVEYVGPWLPTPLVTDLDPADAVTEEEQLGLALLASLERLNPVERAAPGRSDLSLLRPPARHATSDRAHRPGSTRALNWRRSRSLEAGSRDC
jgi:RNA polymerase sigma-70 factor, ECF subfamily